jgi:hypothetical protein
MIEWSPQTLYIIHVFFKLSAASQLPDTINVDSAVYVPEVRSALVTLFWATKLQAINTFLNWSKMIAYLSYAPQFAVLTDTLKAAAPEIFGFAFIFFVVRQRQKRPRSVSMQRADAIIPFPMLQIFLSPSALWATRSSP